MAYDAKKTLDVVPLMLVTLKTNADFPLKGDAVAEFTLPKSQISGRGFALQLFSVVTQKKHTTYKPLWTFARSVLDKTTLTFRFAEPKTTIAKNAAYALVLYGDDLDKQHAGMPSAAASASPAVTGSPVPSSTASARASARASAPASPAASPSGSPAAVSSASP